MKHIHWIVLNDGVSERVTEDAIDPGEEAVLIDRVLIPLTNSEQGKVAGRESPYWVIGEISGKYALLRLMDEEAAVADVGICLHARAAKGLWSRLRMGDTRDLVAESSDRPPQEPWCGVRCYAPEGALPAWFDSWTKTAAMAVLRREGW